MTDKQTVFFLSDHTGLTVEAMGHALLSQFEGIEYEYVHWPFLDSEEKANKVIRRINKAATESVHPPLVFSSLVDPAIRRMIRDTAARFYDFFEEFTPKLEADLGRSSSNTRGLTHGMGNRRAYNERIHAVHYALDADDGAVVKNYHAADVILLGVSRSGKTPTCLYLGLQYGLLAANYPLTEDDLDNRHLPGALTPYRDKLFGLTIDPNQLQRIRRERRASGRYASMEQCAYEVQQAEALYRRHDITFLDTTSKSVEEIAASLLQMAGMDSRLGMSK